MTQGKEIKIEPKTVYDSLHRIQKSLKAPKGQYNSFGKYHYRSCEDILEGLKLVLDNGETVTITDKIVMIGNRFYVEATASFCFGGQCVSSTGYAREPESRKGMDESQVTGSTSSYARKYALNALFLIDDTKDADATNDHGKKEEKQKEPSVDELKARDDAIERCKPIAEALKSSKDEKQLDTILKLQKETIDKLPDDLKKRILDIADERRTTFSPLNAG
jgi:hypothetical protein